MTVAGCLNLHAWDPELLLLDRTFDNFVLRCFFGLMFGTPCGSHLRDRHDMKGQPG